MYRYINIHIMDITPKPQNEFLYEGVYNQSFSSIAQSCPTLCDPMNCSMPGLPVHHQFPEFTRTRAH